MKYHHLVRLLLLGVVCTLLAGCSHQSSLEELQTELNSIKMKPRGRIEPIPEPITVPSFIYAAHQLRAPFTPYVQEPPSTDISARKVEPDPNRPHEALEQYPLESLAMKGTLDWAKSGGVQQAIVEDPTGQEHFVHVGNYLGKNQGRITAITPHVLSVVEIVPDGRGSWVERPRSLDLNER